MIEKKVIIYKEKIVFEKINMPIFKRIPKLYQSQEACFMFVNKGEFYVRTPNEYLLINRGKALLAKCSDYFFETTKKQRQKHESIEVLGVLLYPEIIENLFQTDFPISNYRVNFKAKQVQVNRLLQNFKESIDILLDHPELADEAMISNKLKEFVLLISKIHHEPAYLDFISALFQSSTADFRKTIHNNLYATITMEELAHLCQMSLSSFKRQFQKQFNKSPAKYIVEKRMQKAEKMLVLTNQRITDVAYDCGYDSISTFNRSFKKKFGLSPSSYRAEKTT